MEEYITKAWEHLDKSFKYITRETWWDFINNDRKFCVYRAFKERPKFEKHATQPNQTSWVNKNGTYGYVIGVAYKDILGFDKDAFDCECIKFRGEI